MEFCILQDGETALIQICYQGDTGAGRFLLEAGAKTDIQQKVRSVSRVLYTK